MRRVDERGCQKTADRIPPRGFPRRSFRFGPIGEVMMDSMEAQAKAIIAAALIVRGAVEVPAMPTGSQRVADAAGMRLRELTDYLYRLLTTEEPGEI
jgi:hypothetical protein